MIGPRLRLAIRVVVWAYVAASIWQLVAGVSQALTYPETPPGWDRVVEIARYVLTDLLAVIVPVALLSIDERLERKA